MEKTFSEYFETLDSKTQSRYKQKLDMLGGIPDPYLIETSKTNLVELEWRSWPSVEYPDIYNYLIATPSPYTKDQLRAYKSLDGYKFATSGWVDKVQVVRVHQRSEPTVLVRARVRHSQRLSVAPLRPWVAVEDTGLVICAHCNCTAGLGEACCHISAVLFTLEMNTKLQDSMSCTSLPCTWLPPSFKPIPYLPVSQIRFITPSQDVTSTKHVPTGSSQPQPIRDIAPSKEEMQVFFQQLNAAGKPAILSLVPEYASRYMPLVDTGELPKPLTDLFVEVYLELTYEELLDKCENILSNVSLTYLQCQAIEKYTRQQCLSKIWFQQRAGRITASKLKQVVRTNLEKPSQSLIRAICYPESARFATKATMYGCKHEKDAKEMYSKTLAKHHGNFKVTRSGLVVDPAYPFFGASPDGIVSCDCCGKGVLEIKCPFTCKDKSFLMASQESYAFCLKDGDNGLKLDTSHAYYFQVQMQMKLCGADYCDFVVWSDSEVMVERILPDDDVISDALQRATKFFTIGILPELVGKWFSKAPNFTAMQLPEEAPQDLVDDLWCYCKRGEFGEMIACSNESCPIIWFHTECLKMTSIPKNDWYCPNCSKSIN